MIAQLIFSLSVLFLISIADLSGQPANNLKLWYTEPAANWNQALPIGNGRLGGMVFGDPHHRHISHLYGLHPGNQINPFTTPELFRAARNSLDLRGDVSTGWSMGWKINCWARLLDGERAYTLIGGFFTPIGFGEEEKEATEGFKGGMYQNMLCAQSVFPDRRSGPAGIRRRAP